MKNSQLLIFFVALFLSSPLLAKESPSSSKVHSAISSNINIKITHKAESNQLIIQDLKTHQVLKRISVLDKRGKISGISGIRDASPRHSFIITLKDRPEVWELNYQNPSPAGFGEWVHDYREDSGEATVSTFPIRRLMLKTPLKNLFIDKEFVKIFSVSCDGNIQIIDLDLGRKVAEFNAMKKLPEPTQRFKTLGLHQAYIQEINARATDFINKNCPTNS